MRLIFLSFIIILCSFYTQAQNYVNEVGLITGLQLSKDLPKRFGISLQYQFRSDEDINQVKGSYIYTTIKYTLIKKHLYSEFEYRYSTSVFRDKHRFGVGLKGKYKLNKFVFSDKLVYQREHEYFNTSYEVGHEPTDYLRNSFQVQWDFKKHWDTYISFEALLKFSNIQNQIDEVRTESGIEWEFIKHHNINLYYELRQEIHQSNPTLTHVIGCKYEWEIPKFKYKEKRQLRKLNIN